MGNTVWIFFPSNIMTQKLVQIHVSILNLENVIGWQLFSLIPFTLPCVPYQLLRPTSHLVNMKTHEQTQQFMLNSFIEQRHV